MPPPLDFSALDGIVMDMDGALWRGEQPLAGLTAWFTFLARRGIPYVLATNNAYWPPDHYVARLAGFGVSVPPDRILTSALATAGWLRGQLPAGATVYVVGGAALRAALAAEGFAVRTDGAGPVDAVVVGVDFQLTYDTLRQATQRIRAGARFVGTNPDRTYPMEDGLAPGAGAILAALEAATDVQPTVIGKPARPLFEAALARLGTAPERTLMLGDRLDTDIAGGQQAGLRTALVTTGVDSPATLATSGIAPDAVFAGLAELVAAWDGAVA
jgi:4-nitrophenyl phosphatase